MKRDELLFLPNAGARRAPLSLHIGVDLRRVIATKHCAPAQSANSVARHWCRVAAQMSADVPKWADAKSMARAYALLYNTLLVRNAPYMMAQMDEDVWRLVYGSAACRPRHMSWAKARDDKGEISGF